MYLKKCRRLFLRLHTYFFPRRSHALILTDNVLGHTTRPIFHNLIRSPCSLAALHVTPPLHTHPHAYNCKLQLAYNCKRVFVNGAQSGAQLISIWQSKSFVTQANKLQPNCGTRMPLPTSIHSFHYRRLMAVSKTLEARVTKWVREKIAQNVAQHIFLSK
jgi:hypothetical protein